ncbi:tetratricopeptide repeat protein [Azospirillum picis]|uniref:protein O-GlcNAc transferase n=1 Tax=Azospirillum picis TaxID=488438 RepID=A0ABU0MLK5_9PROT|nr:tetratricopeptide repeat protein [Azospirillum picis]MBP2300480.1 putative O-linked N-acetylglucosamine transferase (SPINDLY family) [Azospirillum picis]MDQ0534276.1 putative O-linked N-acetylglucosamine transferase (SPINDLY family) [Azospirillum picis]
MTDARQEASSLEQAGRLEEARAAWSRLLDADPADAAALHRLALIARRLGRIAEAVTHFQKSLALRKDLDVYLDFGALLVSVSHWDGAAACYAAALRLDPDSLDAHYGLGLAHHNRGRMAEAEPHYRAVLAGRPDLGSVHGNLGLLLQALGRIAEAVPHHQEAVRRSPGDASAWDNLGTALQQAGAAAEAEAAHRQALLLAPDRKAAWANLSLLHLDQGRSQAARHAARRTAALAPDDSAALMAVGNAAHALALWPEAAAAAAAAVRLAPTAPEARNNLGNALVRLGREEDAVREFRLALDLRPGFFPAMLSLAEALRRRRDDAGALAVLHDLLARDAGMAAGWRLTGQVHLNGHRPRAALQALHRALALLPGDPEAWLDLASASSKAGEPAAAAAAYQRVLRLVPGHVPALAQLVQQRRQLCDWRDLDLLEESLIGAARRGAAHLPPFALLSAPSTPADQLAAAVRWAEKAAGIRSPSRPPAAPASPADRRLRVGYLSADFREHAIAWLVAELLELHDRSGFTIHAYSIGVDDGGPMRRRIAGAVDGFVDLGRMADAAAAERIAADGLDILVDLNGYTAFARTPILAARPAPLQVNWLGYPGTMGAPFIDYIIGDAVVIPPGDDAHYSEAVVRLPHCYQPNDRRRTIAAGTPTRAACGLPEDGFVFCSFNNPYKLTPSLFDRWIRLLRAVPGSVLWLFAPDPAAVGNLRREAATRGLDPRRLVFASPLPLPEHLARHRLADLFLDTLPYNAHTTASDALWAGLPVLTRSGTTFAGRVAASLLRAAGLPELVTADDDAYEALALALVRDPARLAALHRRLADGLAGCPLFDTPRFARHLEAAYRTMADIRRAGAAPRGFDVPALP